MELLNLSKFTWSHPRLSTKFSARIKQTKANELLMLSIKITLPLFNWITEEALPWCEPTAAVIFAESATMAAEDKLVTSVEDGGSEDLLDEIIAELSWLGMIVCA